MVLLGTLVSLPVVWQSADIIMALMAMTNLTAILLLSPDGADYRQRLSAPAAAGYPAHFRCRPLPGYSPATGPGRLE